MIGIADEDHALAVVDPGAFGERGERGLGHLRVVFEAKILQALDQGEPGVEQATSLAPLGTLLHLGLEKRGEVGERGLLLAGGLGGQ